MNFYIYTFGCKVNRYESEVMHNALENAGLKPAQNLQTADVIIINSCTVTSVADSKNRKLIRKLKRENPAAIVVLTGCMPQAFPQNPILFEGCDIVAGNTNRAEIPKLISEFLQNGQQIIKIEQHKKREEAYENAQISHLSNRTRAIIKIQDGCNRYCSYCIIPYARGSVRSKPLAALQTEAESLAKNGYTEVVLVGINLSCYGQDIGLELCDAVKAVGAVQGVARVRLGSLEPEYLTENVLLALHSVPQFCPQFHLSLQSGCNRTLQHMNRKYTTNEYEEIVKNIRRIFKNPAITTDIMVGFPGESEEDFSDSVSFAKKIGFAKIHVFPYSPRAGTKAAEFDEQIEQSIKNQRAAAMLKIADQLHKDFLKTQIGKTESVLFEKQNPKGEWEGFSANYTPVRVSSNDNLAGKIIDVRLISITQDGSAMIGAL
ncbi:MAG: tRNA (N(6)-L-threonylcarbamoyladenosine(37)-C(2))-methylthiotransferase MtaB [Oscillospiraceae bacterium]|nr:tRNA (N(6)-L-threonylcarbamoyladenosine(37)-C(2))-methylthiotransferase MtaB [Oscillospiraceae bacterium]